MKQTILKIYEETKDATAQIEKENGLVAISVLLRTYVIEAIGSDDPVILIRIISLLCYLISKNINFAELIKSFETREKLAEDFSFADQLLKNNFIDCLFFIYCTNTEYKGRMIKYTGVKIDE